MSFKWLQIFLSVCLFVVVLMTISAEVRCCINQIQSNNNAKEYAKERKEYYSKQAKYYDQQTEYYTEMINFYRELKEEK